MKNTKWGLLAVVLMSIAYLLFFIGMEIYRILGDGITEEIDAIAMVLFVGIIVVGVSCFAGTFTCLGKIE